MENRDQFDGVTESLPQSDGLFRRAAPMQLNGQDIRFIHEFQNFLRVRQMSHQHRRHERRQQGGEPGRFFRQNEILRRETLSNQETHGIGAGIDGCFQFGFVFDGANLNPHDRTPKAGGCR